MKPRSVNIGWVALVTGHRSLVQLTQIILPSPIKSVVLTNFEPMKVDDQLIARLAELSRLEFSAEETQQIQQDLEKILSFMEKLNELDTDDVEPLVYVSEQHNVMRKDEVGDMLDKADVLKNAPMKDADYIKVPKVISNDQ